MSSRTEAADRIAVVGAGVVGAAAAWLLQRSGAAVDLYDHRGIGSGASGVAAGWLNPLEGMAIRPEVAALSLASFRLHLEWWSELERVSGIAIDGMRAPVLHVDDGSDPERLDRTLRVYDEHHADGFSAKRIDPGELRRLAPGIGPAWAAAVRTDGDGRLNVLRFTEACAESAKRAGAVIRRDEVTRLLPDGAGVALTACDQIVRYDGAVIAAGPWSARSGDDLGVAIAVEPAKGELVRLDTGGVMPAGDADISASGASIYVRDGLVWAGGTYEIVGFDESPNAAHGDTIVRAADRVVPGLGDARRVRHTACLRPVTPDELPVLAAIPGHDRIVVATGGGKKGILLGPAMAQVAADLVASGRTELPISELGLDRRLPA